MSYVINIVLKFNTGISYFLFIVGIYTIAIVPVHLNLKKYSENVKEIQFEIASCE